MLSQLDVVLEVAVVGRRDGLLGEVPISYLCLYPGSTTSVNDLLEHCRTQLTRIKTHESIEILEALSKNARGPRDKPGLRWELGTHG